MRDKQEENYLRNQSPSQMNLNKTTEYESYPIGTSMIPPTQPPYYERNQPPRKQRTFLKLSLGFLGGLLFSASIVGFLYFLGTTVAEEETFETSPTEVVAIGEGVNPVTEDNLYGFQLNEIGMTKDDLFEYVSGKVTNLQDNPYSSVEVKISLFDKDGDLLGHAYGYADDIKGKETVDFHATIYEEDVKGYKVETITGFDY